MGIRITGLSLAIENISKNLEENVRRAEFAMNAVADDTVGRIQDRITQDKMVDTGSLLASITKKTERTQNKIQSDIFSNELHAYFLEFGRKGGKPPSLLMLTGWASRKGILKALKATSDPYSYKTELMTARMILRNSRKGGIKSTEKSKKPLDPIVVDLIRLLSIQQSIAVNGTKGRYLFTKVLKEAKKTIQKDFIRYYKV